MCVIVMSASEVSLNFIDLCFVKGSPYYLLSILFCTFVVIYFFNFVFCNSVFHVLDTHINVNRHKDSMNMII